MKLEILNELTLDEIETIELIIGRPIDDLMAEGELKGKALKAIVFVYQKKTNPAFTIEEAAKWTFSDAVNLLKRTSENPKA